MVTSKVAVARRGRTGRRRWRWLLWLFALVALLLGLLGLAYRPVGAWYLRHRLLPRLAGRYALKLRISRVELGFDEVRINGVELRPLDTTAASTFRLGVRTSYRLSDVLRGRVALAEVVVDVAEAKVIRDAHGRTGFEPLLRRLTRSSGAPQRSSAQSGPSIGSIRFSGGAATFRDLAKGVGARVSAFRGAIRRGAVGSLRLEDVGFELPLVAPKRMHFAWLALSVQGLSRVVVRVAGGELALLPRLKLTAIGGTIEPSIDGNIRIDLAGSYGGARAQLWSAAGTVDPRQRRGSLRLRAERFSLSRVREILGATPVVRPERAEIDGSLKLDYDAGVLSLDGQIAASGLAIFHPRLARELVDGLAAEVRARARITRRRVDVQELKLRVRDVKLTLSGFVDRIGDKPLVSMRLQMPRVACQKLLEAIPPALVPRLVGAKLRGKLGADLRLLVDYQALEKLELGGEFSFRRCSVASLPADLQAERLEGSFEHRVETKPDEWRTFTIGPENPDFVPLAAIPTDLINAFLTTEDGGFFRHRGFISSQFRNALAQNLLKGDFRLGASTITMQTVKNVLLSHEKTLSRKLQELVLTWYVEQHLSKERLMEIYLNAIEYGPGIYGIGPAARSYFDKSPQELSTLEAAFFASILPSPKRRYAYFCRGELSPSWERYVRRILGFMHARKRLTDEQLKATEVQKIVFHRDFEALSKHQCLKDLKALQKSWSEAYWSRLAEAVGNAAPHQRALYLPAAAQVTAKRPPGGR